MKIQAIVASCFLFGKKVHARAIPCSRSTLTEGQEDRMVWTIPIFRILQGGPP
ncbi:hypothetical protein DWUX_1451 [Desulfovibrio diazotrophicus]|nr:hypothetical protein DWUX_1451 [Desulfovibrio diazotrophicus]